MSEPYALPARAGKKIKIARETCQPVFIYGTTGSGKTSLIENAKETGNCLLVSGTDESAAAEVEKKINSPEKRLKVIAIDDLPSVTGEGFRELVKKAALNENVWLILSSRGRLPEWLKPVDFRRKFMVINEDDLKLRLPEIQSLFLRLSLAFETDDIERLLSLSEGNAYTIYSVAAHLKEGMSFKKATVLESRTLTDRTKEYIIPALPKETREFLTAVSVTDSFTAEMAAVVFGISDAKPYIRATEECSSFLLREGTFYRIRPFALSALRGYVKENVSENAMWKYYERAGKWYEDHGLDHLAMTLYEKTGSRKRINALLLKNSKKDPGKGYFYEMRRFYLSLSEEEALSSPDLMAALSILHSMLLDTSSSEKWYEKLKASAENADPSQKRQVELLTNSLDIKLPHRKTEDMIPALEHLCAILKDNPDQTTDFSVTGSIPSLLDGKKDLSEWAKSPKEFTERYGELLSAFNPPLQKGLLPLFLSECAYQKGEEQSIILKPLTEARFEAEQGGSPEILFAAASLNARVFVSSGELDSAGNVIRSFSEKLEGFGNDALKLRPNVEAEKVRLALYRGDMEAVDEWLELAPNEEEFFMGQRFQYLTKVRAYIAKEKYISALSLIEKLLYYAGICHRTMLSIELLILSAVIRQRTSEPYRDELFKALEMMSELGFFSIMAEEGPAVIPLLTESLKDIEKNNKIDKDFFEKLYSMVKKTANHYPLYLKASSGDAPSLPERALTILRMQSEGNTMKEIAEKLSMKEPTVKYYIKNTYLKLSASSKTDAVMKAKALGLL